MHEVGVAHSILDIVIKTAKENEASSVAKVSINIGTLSGVEPRSLEFALDSLKEGTIAQNTAFELNIIQAKGKCGECGKESQPDTFLSLCSHCGSPALDISEGGEFEISYIDID